MSRLAAAMAPARSLNQAVERARLAEQTGYDSIWLSQLPNERDTSLVLAEYAHGTEANRAGIVRLSDLHQASDGDGSDGCNVDELSGGRFRLGTGISYKVTVEGLPRVP